MQDKGLEKAHGDFCEAMLDRLEQKEREGHGGWNEMVFMASIKDRMISKALKESPSTKDYIDIANFAMMLAQPPHRREEAEAWPVSSPRGYNGGGRHVQHVQHFDT